MVIQDILKALIKNDYDTSYLEDIHEDENEEEEEVEDKKGAIIQNTSKFFY